MHKKILCFQKIRAFLSVTNITLTLFIRLNKLNFLKIIMKNSNK